MGHQIIQDSLTLGVMNIVEFQGVVLPQVLIEVFTCGLGVEVLTTGLAIRDSSPH
jgi:hypothetical protein